MTDLVIGFTVLWVWLGVVTLAAFQVSEARLEVARESGRLDLLRETLDAERESLKRGHETLGRIFDKLNRAGVEVPPLVASEVQPARGTAHGGNAASSDQNTRGVAE